MMFILLLSTLPRAMLDQRPNPTVAHAQRLKLRVRGRRIVIATLAHVFHALGLDRSTRR